MYIPTNSWLTMISPLHPVSRGSEERPLHSLTSMYFLALTCTPSRTYSHVPKALPIVLPSEPFSLLVHQADGHGLALSSTRTNQDSRRNMRCSGALTCNPVPRERVTPNRGASPAPNLSNGSSTQRVRRCTDYVYIGTLFGRGTTSTSLASVAFS